MRCMRIVTAVFVLGSLAPSGLAAQGSVDSRCGAELDADDTGGVVWLPGGVIFCPLAADPKAERSFMKYLRGDFATMAQPGPGRTANIGAVGFGDSFALARVDVPRPGLTAQIDIAGAVFSQFNMDKPSFDLINADYLLGGAITVRRAGLSARGRLYHQSSHLGDEFLLSGQRDRINVSYEAIELLVSQELGPLRVYGGVEDYYRRGPEDLAERLLHAGTELRPEITGRGRMLLAVDLKLLDHQGWDRAVSARAGLEIAHVARAGPLPRVIALVGEFYDGASPYGQFYRQDIRYWGLGFQLVGI